MSGFDLHAHAARVRELAVQDVLERGMTPLAAAVTWGVLREEVERWVEDARPGAQAD